MTESTLPSCSIIIPCFNEETIIFDSLSRLTTFLDTQQQYAWTLVIVSDGSTDKSVSEIERFIAQYTGLHKIKFHHLTTNQGKGNAIKEGLQQTETDYYGFIDADLSLDYQSMIHALPELFQKNDIIIAQRESRIAGGYSKLRAIGSRLFSSIARTLFSLPYQDIQCGLKFFNQKGKNILLAIEQTRFSFDVEFLVRAKKQNLSITAYTVTWKHNESSSVGSRDITRYLLDIVSITEIAYSKHTWTTLYAITAIILSFLCFGWTMQYGYFFSDDFTWMWHGSRISEGMYTIWNAHMSSFYSPMLNFFYAFLSSTVGFTIWIYFFFGICIHAGVAFLTGLITRLVSTSSLAGWIAVVLLALGGSAFEPLVWVGANMHSIAALFMTLAVFTLLRSYQRTPLSAVWLLLSCLASIGAILTKEVSVILPGFLFIVSLSYFLKEKKAFFSPSRIVYGTSMIAIWSIYLFQQYRWQTESAWVTQGVWNVSLQAFTRLPTALLDVFIPLRPILSHTNAFFFSIVAIIFFGYILYRFRKNNAVHIGLSWALIASLPVLFFQTQSWWELLPSRYTYTVRIGMVIAIAAMITTLLRDGKTLRLAYRFFWVLVFASLLHTMNMGQIVYTQYHHGVYQTGRSLHDLALSFQDTHATRIVFTGHRPFPRNNAHVVGAFDVIAHIPESQLLFIDPNETYKAKDGDMIVRWDDEKKKYLYSEFNPRHLE